MGEFHHILRQDLLDTWTMGLNLLNICRRGLHTSPARLQVIQGVTPTKRICIVGAGPAGFYAAQLLLKQLSDCVVDVVEKLPVPFGLVR